MIFSQAVYIKLPAWIPSGPSAKRKGRSHDLRHIVTFSASYDTARKIKEGQDAYCAKALAGEWDNLGDFPEDLQWEALVDVLRGRVKVLVTVKCLWFSLTFGFSQVHTHCYEAVDLDDFVRVRWISDCMPETTYNLHTSLQTSSSFP